MNEMPRSELVVLFGPPAVGKTTVGRELSALTGFKLYHGHLTMDALTEFFPYGSPSFLRLHRLTTLQILEEAAQQGLSIILTCGWRFDDPSETAFNLAVAEPFRNRHGLVHYVELWAPLSVRLERNGTEERLASKKTDWSTREYLEQQDRAEARDSKGTLPLALPFLRLETSHLKAGDAARRIVDYLDEARTAAGAPPT